MNDDLVREKVGERGFLIHRRSFIKGAAGLFAACTIPAISGAAEALEAKPYSNGEMLMVSNILDVPGKPDHYLLCRYEILGGGRYSGNWTCSYRDKAAEGGYRPVSREEIEKISYHNLENYMLSAEEAIKRAHSKHGWPVPPRGRVMGLPWKS